jgi:hypothetical protein
MTRSLHLLIAGLLALGHLAVPTRAQAMPDDGTVWETDPPETYDDNDAQAAADEAALRRARNDDGANMMLGGSTNPDVIALLGSDPSSELPYDWKDSGMVFDDNGNVSHFEYQDAIGNTQRMDGDYVALQGSNREDILNKMQGARPDLLNAVSRGGIPQYGMRNKTDAAGNPVLDDSGMPVKERSLVSICTPNMCYTPDATTSAALDGLVSTPMGPGKMVDGQIVATNPDDGKQYSYPVGEDGKVGIGPPAPYTPKDTDLAGSAGFDAANEGANGAITADLGNDGSTTLPVGEDGFPETDDEGEKVNLVDNALGNGGDKGTTGGDLNNPGVTTVAAGRSPGDDYTPVGGAPGDYNPNGGATQVAGRNLGRNDFTDAQKRQMYDLNKDMSTAGVNLNPRDPRNLSASQGYRAAVAKLNGTPEPGQRVYGALEGLKLFESATANQLVSCGQNAGGWVLDGCGAGPGQRTGQDELSVDVVFGSLQTATLVVVDRPAEVCEGGLCS